MLIVNVSNTTVSVFVKGYGTIKLGAKDSHAVVDTFYIDEVRRVVSIFGDANLRIMTEEEYKEYKSKEVELLKEDFSDDKEKDSGEEEEVITGDLTSEQLDEVSELDERGDLDNFLDEVELTEEGLKNNQADVDLFLGKVYSLINHEKLDKQAKLKAIRKIATHLEIEFDGRMGINSLCGKIEEALKGE